MGVGGQLTPRAPGEGGQRFFQDLPARPARPQQGTGAGVLLSAAGDLLPNHHVGAGANAVTGTRADGQEAARASLHEVSQRWQDADPASPERTALTRLAAQAD
jgi:S1-C subfamily serine protease